MVIRLQTGQTCRLRTPTLSRSVQGHLRPTILWLHPEISVEGGYLGVSRGDARMSRRFTGGRRYKYTGIPDKSYFMCKTSARIIFAFLPGPPPRTNMPFSLASLPPIGPQVGRCLLWPPATSQHGRIPRNRSVFAQFPGSKILHDDHHH